MRISVVLGLVVIGVVAFCFFGQKSREPQARQEPVAETRRIVMAAESLASGFSSQLPNSQNQTTAANQQAAPQIPYSPLTASHSRGPIPTSAGTSPKTAASASSSESSSLYNPKGAAPASHYSSSSTGPLASGNPAPSTAGTGYAAWPASLQPIPENSTTLTAQQIDIADSVAEQFLSDSAVQNLPADSEQAFLQWEDSSAANNDLLRAKLGWQGFNTWSLETAKAKSSN